MSKFSNYIGGLADEGKVLLKDELIKLVSDAKDDKAEFVRKQAEKLEGWIELLADGDLTAAGFKKLVGKMEVLADLEELKLSVRAKASAQKLADGIRKLVIEGLFKLL